MGVARTVSGMRCAAAGTCCMQNIVGPSAARQGRPRADSANDGDRFDEAAGRSGANIGDVGQGIADDIEKAKLALAHADNLAKQRAEAYDVLARDEYKDAEELWKGQAELAAAMAGLPARQTVPQCSSREGPSRTRDCPTIAVVAC